MDPRQDNINSEWNKPLAQSKLRILESVIPLLQSSKQNQYNSKTFSTNCLLYFTMNAWNQTELYGTKKLLKLIFGESEYSIYKITIQSRVRNDTLFRKIGSISRFKLSWPFFLLRLLWQCQLCFSSDPPDGRQHTKNPSMLFLSGCAISLLL